MILPIALAGVILFIAAGLAWTARLLHVGSLDAQALAEKVATPAPTSALDWPELHLQAVVAQPDEQQPSDRSLVLLHVGWPAHPQRAATLLVALDREDCRSLSLLAQWCAGQASISPERRAGAELELRRRQSLERVHAVLIAEDLRSVMQDTARRVIWPTRPRRARTSAGAAWRRPARSARRARPRGA